MINGLGSTACVVVVRKATDKEHDGFYTTMNLGTPRLSLSKLSLVFSLGDSRAVLSRNEMAIELTTDHKPNHPAELQRIKSLGGKVRWHGLMGKNRNPIPSTGVYRINGVLAVARSFGTYQ